MRLVQRQENLMTHDSIAKLYQQLPRRTLKRILLYNIPVIPVDL